MPETKFNLETAISEFLYLVQVFAFRIEQNSRNTELGNKIRAIKKEASEQSSSSRNYLLFFLNKLLEVISEIPNNDEAAKEAVKNSFQEALENSKDPNQANNPALATAITTTNKAEVLNVVQIQETLKNIQALILYNGALGRAVIELIELIQIEFVRDQELGEVINQIIHKISMLGKFLEVEGELIPPENLEQAQPVNKEALVQDFADFIATHANAISEKNIEVRHKIQLLKILNTLVTAFSNSEMLSDLEPIFSSEKQKKVAEAINNLTKSIPVLRVNDVFTKETKRLQKMTTRAPHLDPLTKLLPQANETWSIEKRTEFVEKLLELIDTGKYVPKHELVETRTSILNSVATDFTLDLDDQNSVHAALSLLQIVQHEVKAILENRAKERSKFFQKYFFWDLLDRLIGFKKEDTENKKGRLIIIDNVKNAFSTITTISGDNNSYVAAVTVIQKELAKIKDSDSKTKTVLIEIQNKFAQFMSHIAPAHAATAEIGLLANKTFNQTIVSELKKYREEQRNPTGFFRVFKSIFYNGFTVTIFDVFNKRYKKQTENYIGDLEKRISECKNAQDYVDYIMVSAHYITELKKQGRPIGGDHQDVISQIRMQQTLVIKRFAKDNIGLTFSISQKSLILATLRRNFANNAPEIQFFEDQFRTLGVDTDTDAVNIDKALDTIAERIIKDEVGSQKNEAIKKVVTFRTEIEQELLGWVILSLTNKTGQQIFKGTEKTTAANMLQQGTTALSGEVLPVVGGLVKQGGSYLASELRSADIQELKQACDTLAQLFNGFEASYSLAQKTAALIAYRYSLRLQSLHQLKPDGINHLRLNYNAACLRMIKFIANGGLNDIQDKNKPENIDVVAERLANAVMDNEIRHGTLVFEKGFPHKSDNNPFGRGLKVEGFLSHRFVAVPKDGGYIYFVPKNTDIEDVKKYGFVLGTEEECKAKELEQLVNVPDEVKITFDLLPLDDKYMVDLKNIALSVTQIKVVHHQEDRMKRLEVEKKQLEMKVDSQENMLKSQVQVLTETRQKLEETTNQLQITQNEVAEQKELLKQVLEEVKILRQKQSEEKTKKPEEIGNTRQEIEKEQFQQNYTTNTNSR